MRRKASQAGLTLIELLIVLVMIAVLAVAISFAFAAEIKIQRLTETRRASADQTNSMEQELTRTIQEARLSGITGDTSSYFQGTTDNGTSSLGCDRLTFTTQAPGIPFVTVNSQDDWETQNQDQGPVGGLTEVSFGTTAVGDPGQRVGLFERIQHPADSDPTQGGNEYDLDPQIDTVGFQFWDGLEWIDSWDTTTGSVRLPAAVQVSYTLKGDTTNTVHMFAVTIPASDVTPSNPYSATTTSTATTTTGGTGG